MNMKLSQKENDIVYNKLFKDARFLSSLARAMKDKQTHELSKFRKNRTQIKNIYSWKNNIISTLIQKYKHKLKLIDIQSYYWKILFCDINAKNEYIHFSYKDLHPKAKDILRNIIETANSSQNYMAAA